MAEMIVPSAAQMDSNARNIHAQVWEVIASS
jgi:hypothetical protein